MKLNITKGLRRQTRIQIIVLAVLTTASFATLAVSRSSVQTAPHINPTQANQQRVPIARANLTRFGFEPAEIRLPAGRCLLAVRNISGRGVVELQVKRSNSSQALVAEQHSTGKRHWEKLMEFGVGEYLITEAGNPGKPLRLIVVPPESL